MKNPTLLALALGLSASLFPIRYTQPHPASPDVRVATIVIASADSYQHPTGQNPTHSDYLVPTGADAGAVVTQALADHFTARGRKGARVVFLEGDYEFQTAVVIADGAQLIQDQLTFEGCTIPTNELSSGAHGTRLLKHATYTGSIFAATGNHAPSNGNQFDQRVSGLRFVGLTFKGNGDNDTEAALQFIDCNNVYIDRCAFEHCAPAVVNVSGWDFDTRNSVFLNCGSKASNQPAVLASDSESWFGNGEYNDSHNLSLWRIRDCIWQPLPGVALQLDARTDRYPGVNNIEVIGCKFEGWNHVAETAIQGRADFCKVTNSQFFVSPNAATTGSRRHIDMGETESDGTIIANNTFYDTRFDVRTGNPAGIRLQGDGCNVHGNVFKIDLEAGNPASLVELVGGGVECIVSGNSRIGPTPPVLEGATIGQQGTTRLVAQNSDSWQPWQHSATFTNQLFADYSLGITLNGQEKLRVANDLDVQPTGSPASDSWMKVRLNGADRYIQLYK